MRFRRATRPLTTRRTTRAPGPSRRASSPPGRTAAPGSAARVQDEHREVEPGGTLALLRVRPERSHALLDVYVAGATDIERCIRPPRLPAVQPPALIDEEGLPGRFFTSRRAATSSRAPTVLADRLSEGLKPLARVAYNYRWSWMRGRRGRLPRHQPAPLGALRREPGPLPQRPLARRRRRRSSSNHDLRRPHRRRSRRSFDAELARPAPAAAGDRRARSSSCAPSSASTSRCRSTPAASACSPGDILKEASDQALEMIGIGLLYRRGYFRQRLDIRGPPAGVLARARPEVAADGARHGRRRRAAPARGRRSSAGRLAFQVWRVDVGRVPLLLLDAEVPENDAVQRWTSARLYEGNRAVRLAQYGLLGIGGARVLQALGIEPAVVHLNEGHPALAALEFAAADVARRHAARGGVRARPAARSSSPRTRRSRPATRPTPPRSSCPPTTTCARGSGSTRRSSSTSAAAFPARSERPGMTPLAIRISRRRNGVSRLHGEVSRQMWRPLFPKSVEPPITHVTNGAHLPDLRVASRSAMLLERAHRRDVAARRPARRRTRGRASAGSRTRSSGPRAARRGARLDRVPPGEEHPGQPAARRAARVRAARSSRASTPTRSRSASRAGSRRTSASTSSNQDPDAHAPDLRRRPPGAARDRRQGAPERRARQGRAAALLRLRARRRRRSPAAS